MASLPTPKAGSPAAGALGFYICFSEKHWVEALYSRRQPFKMATGNAGFSAGNVPRLAGESIPAH